MFFDLRKTGLILFLSVLVIFSGHTQEVPLSYEQAVKLLLDNNKELKISNKAYEIAKTEKGISNSLWYPFINASGNYVHMSNKIEVRQSLSTLLKPLEDIGDEFLPDLPVVNDVLNRIGANTLSFPLFPNNLTTIDAEVIWPVFTGGKRLFANSISRNIVSISLAREREVNSSVRLKLVDTYFALRLGYNIIRVRKDNYEAFCLQLSDAEKMEKEGIINKAARLVVQVGMAEAKREYEESCKDYEVAQAAFRSVVNMIDTTSVFATTPLFINTAIENRDYFISMMKQNSNLIELIELQRDIASLNEKVAKSEYVPEIAFFGRQNIYSNGISRFLFPRNMIGVGFTWNIFDGLSREKRIKQSKLSGISLELEKEKLISDLEVGVDKAYTSTQIALDNINALKTTMALSKELLRIREREFKEGMATSTDLVNARTALNNVRLAYLFAYYQYDSALITLLSLSGLSAEFELYKSKGITENIIFD